MVSKMHWNIDDWDDFTKGFYIWTCLLSPFIIIPLIIYTPLRWYTIFWLPIVIAFIMYPIFGIISKHRAKRNRVSKINWDIFDWDDVLMFYLLACFLSVIITILLIIYTPLRWHTIFWLPIVISFIMYPIFGMIFKHLEKKQEEERETEEGKRRIEEEERKTEIQYKLIGLTKEELEEREKCINYLYNKGYERERFESLEYDEIKELEEKEKYINYLYNKGYSIIDLRDYDLRSIKELVKEEEKKEKRKIKIQEELKGLTKEELKEREKYIAYLVINKGYDRDKDFELLGYYEILEIYKKSVREEDR